MITTHLNGIDLRAKTLIKDFVLEIKINILNGVIAKDIVRGSAFNA